jgi:hypothetical protein
LIHNKQTFAVRRKWKSPLIGSRNLHSGKQKSKMCVYLQLDLKKARAKGKATCFTLIATELKKGESRGGKNCHAETIMNAKS